MILLSKPQKDEEFHIPSRASFKSLAVFPPWISGIDREHMLMFFAWSKTGHFQLTDSIIEMAER